MNRLALFCTAAVYILTLGCASQASEQSFELLESQQVNSQVLDLRVTNLEDRVTKVESEIGELRSEKITPPKLKKKTASSNVSTKKRPITPRKIEPKAKNSSPISSLAQNKATPSPSIAKQSEKKSYEEALNNYYKNDYQKSKDQFNSFIKQYPKSKLVPNALYWIGECEYSRRDFSSAIVSFKNVNDKYPKHEKAAASLLKVGMSYAKLKDMENAKFYWQILLDDFPGSNPAKLAAKQMPKEE